MADTTVASFHARHAVRHWTIHHLSNGANGYGDIITIQARTHEREHESKPKHNASP